MDEETIARAKLYIVKMTENAKAFTEELGLPPEAMPTVLEIMYKDGKHLPEVSEVEVFLEIEQHRHTYPRATTNKKDRHDTTYFTGDIRLLISLLTRGFMIEHMGRKIKHLENLHKAILQIPVKILIEKNTSFSLTDALQYQSLGHELDFPIISTMAWVVTQWHSLINNNSHEQVQTIIIQEAETRKCSPEESRKLAGYVLTRLPDLIGNPIDHQTQVNTALGIIATEQDTLTSDDPKLLVFKLSDEFLGDEFQLEWGSPSFEWGSSSDKYERWREKNILALWIRLRELPFDTLTGNVKHLWLELQNWDSYRPWDDSFRTSKFTGQEMLSIISLVSQVIAAWIEVSKKNTLEQVRSILSNPNNHNELQNTYAQAAMARGCPTGKSRRLASFLIKKLQTDEVFQWLQRASNSPAS